MGGGKVLYPYAVVEGAMAEFFEVRPQGQPALRSRIRNLQRLGLMKAGSVEGTKHLFTKYMIFELALALCLAELGVEPRRIGELISSASPSPAENMRWLDVNKKIRSEWVFAFSPSYISSGKSKLELTLSKHAKKKFDSHPWIAVINIENLMNKVEASLRA